MHTAALLPPTGLDHGHAADLSLAAVVQRLHQDYAPTHTVEEIIALVRGCRTQIDLPSPDAIPELVERLARQRLRDAANAAW